MLPKYVYIVLAFVGLVLVANLVLLDYLFFQQRSQISDLSTRAGTLADSLKLLGSRMFGEVQPSGGQTTQTLNTCPGSCVSLITSATASGRTATSSLLAPVVQTVAPAARGEYFVPMGSGTVSVGNNWQFIESAQATFDAANFGNIKQAYFEAIMHLNPPNGELHARLFDITTPSIFWGTDVKTILGTAQFLSAPITLTGGQKTYKVQMYSTLSPGVLDQARIRIVTQ